MSKRKNNNRQNTDKAENELVESVENEIDEQIEELADELSSEEDQQHVD